VIERFSRAERWIHRLVAILMLTCIVTAFVLYEGSAATLVGHRRLVELIHVWSGFALPVPLLVGLISAAYRADLRRLNRFSDIDRRWLRPGSQARKALAVSKFNAGQKLNGALSAAAIFVLLGTGTLMYFTHLVRLSWRTGSTFVHDWAALAVGLLVLGHIYRAVTDPESRTGMRTGWVSLDWARRNHSAWATEADEPSDPSLILNDED
jgi:formate dehydrogenase subunit gamma